MIKMNTSGSETISSGERVQTLGAATLPCINCLHGHGTLRDRTLDCRLYHMQPTIYWTRGSISLIMVQFVAF